MFLSSCFVTPNKQFSSLFFRLQEWRTDTKLDKIELNLLNPDLCISCGHKGKLQKHTKSGCAECGTIIKCNDDYK